MRVDRLADGLWRWTAAAADGAEGNCVYHEHPDGIVLIDPLPPADAADAERFWRALDRDVERIGPDRWTRPSSTPRGAAGDDVLDALVLAVRAAAWATGGAVVEFADPHRDRRGRRVRIRG